MLTNREKDCIQRYKEYAKKNLPMTETLQGLWAPDFEPNENETLDEQISTLRLYLDHLKKYSDRLMKTAELREKHYLLFIKNKREEDIGHKKWRLGMNEIAKDAEEKFEYWNATHDRIFKSYCHKMCNRRKPPPKSIHCVNVDFETDKRFLQTIIQKPKMSDKEKKRRRKERQKEKKRKREKETSMFDFIKQKQIDVQQISNKLKTHKTIDFDYLSKRIRSRLKLSDNSTIIDTKNIHPYADNSMLLCSDFYYVLLFGPTFKKMRTMFQNEDQSGFKYELEVNDDFLNGFEKCIESVQFCKLFMKTCYMNAQSKNNILSTKLFENFIINMCISKLVQNSNTVEFKKFLESSYNKHIFDKKFCKDCMDFWFANSYIERTRVLENIINMIKMNKKDKDKGKMLYNIRAILVIFNPFIINEQNMSNIVLNGSRLKCSSFSNKLMKNIINEYNKMRDTAHKYICTLECSLMKNF